LKNTQEGSASARLLVSCVMARKAAVSDFLMVIWTLMMNSRGAISLIVGVGEDMVAVAVVGRLWLLVLDGERLAR
jgi:hypothetical protein